MFHGYVKFPEGLCKHQNLGVTIVMGDPQKGIKMVGLFHRKSRLYIDEFGLPLFQAFQGVAYLIGQSMGYVNRIEKSQQ